MAVDPDDQAQAIAQDVERTQDAMGKTVEKIEEKLTPREITRSVIGDDAMNLGEELLQIAKENPIPVAMIVGGALWLVARSRSPLITRTADRLIDRVKGSGDSDLRPRSAEPAPIGPPPARGEEFDRRQELG